MLGRPADAGGVERAARTNPMRPAVPFGPEAILSDAQDSDGERTQAMARFLAGIEARGFRLALALLGDREDALDAMQDAMLALVRRYAARDPAEWTPLFWAILRSRITDQQRRRAFRGRFRAWFGAGFGGARDDDDLGDPLEAVASDAPEPSTLVGQHAALEAIDAAVRALPARQQQAFTLRIYEGLDVAATAAAMGCSTGSVKTHLSRAMSALRPVLEAHLP